MGSRSSSKGRNRWPISPIGPRSLYLLLRMPLLSRSIQACAMCRSAFPLGPPTAQLSSHSYSCRGSRREDYAPFSWPTVPTSAFRIRPQFRPHPIFPSPQADRTEVKAPSDPTSRVPPDLVSLHDHLRIGLA